jgi:hypothetical protein
MSRSCGFSWRHRCCEHGVLSRCGRRPQAAVQGAGRRRASGGMGQLGGSLALPRLQGGDSVDASELQVGQDGSDGKACRLNPVLQTRHAFSFASSREKGDGDTPLRDGGDTPLCERRRGCAESGGLQAVIRALWDGLPGCRRWRCRGVRAGTV